MEVMDLVWIPRTPVEVLGARQEVEIQPSEAHWRMAWPTAVNGGGR